jgi:fused signal recognition particle receptor
MQQKEKKGFFKGLMDKISGEEPAEKVPESPAIPASKAAAADETAKKPGLFDRLRAGLKKTTEGLVGRIDTLVLGRKEIDADTLDELEEILITSDIGVKTTAELIRTLEQRLKRDELKNGEALRAALKEEILARLSAHHSRKSENRSCLSCW